MEDLKPDIQDQAHNGHNGGGGNYSDVMGLADQLAITTMQRIQESLATMMITGSNKPMEAWPRTIVSMKELKLKLRIYLRRNTFLFGASKYDEKETIDLIARPAVEGLARKQAMHVSTHQPMPIHRGPLGRTADFDNQQSTGPMA